MPGRIFVTGGSGFVGRNVIDELVRRGYAVNALARGDELDTRDGHVQTIRGDLFDVNALNAGMAGCDAAIHLVGIIAEKPAKGVTFERIHHEGTRALVDAAKRSGVRCYVQMSALGTRPGAVSGYHKTKYKAEELVRASGLEWTIIRPSMIHGPGGEFMRMEAAWARGKSMPFLFMPYFGAGVLGTGGAGRIQPVFVGDVTRAFVDAIEKPETVRRTYDLGGPEAMTWGDMHRIASEIIVGKRRPVVPIPAWYGKMLAAVTPSALLPFNRDQIIMSQEDNTCDLAKFVQDFGWEPRAFAPTLQGYAREL